MKKFLTLFLFFTAFVYSENSNNSNDDNKKNSQYDFATETDIASDIHVFYGNLEACLEQPVPEEDKRFTINLNLTPDLIDRHYKDYKDSGILPKGEFDALSQYKKQEFSMRTIEEWNAYEQFRNRGQFDYSLEKSYHAPIFEQYNYYQFENFRKYLKTKPGYKDAIIEICKKIDSDPIFKYMVDNVDGWKYGGLTEYFKKEGGEEYKRIFEEQEKLKQKINLVSNKHNRNWIREKAELYPLECVVSIFDQDNVGIIDRLKTLKADLSKKSDHEANINNKQLNYISSRLEAHEQHQEIRHREYEFKSQTETFINSSKFKKYELIKDIATPVQHQINLEILKTLDATAQIAHDNPKNEVIKRFSSSILDLCKAVQILSQQDEYIAAYYALDAAHSLAELCGIIQDDLKINDNKKLDSDLELQACILDNKISLCLAAVSIIKKNSSQNPVKGFFTKQRFNIGKNLQDIWVSANNIIILNKMLSKREIIDGIELALLKPYILPTGDLDKDFMHALAYARNIKIFYNELNKAIDQNIADGFYIPPSTDSVVITKDAIYKFDKFGNRWEHDKVYLSAEGAKLFGWISPTVMQERVIDKNTLIKELNAIGNVFVCNAYQLSKKTNHLPKPLDQQENQKINSQLHPFIANMQMQKDAAQVAGNSLFSDRCQQRIDAYNKTQLNKGEQSLQSYFVSPSASVLLAQHSINIKSLEQFTGTAMQHQVHGEYVELINQTAEFNKICPDSQLTHSVVQFGRLASALNEEKKSQEALSVLDFCKLSLAEALPLKVEAPDLKELAALGRGIAASGQKFVKALMHPIDTLLETTCTLINIIDKLPASSTDSISIGSSILPNELSDKALREQEEFWRVLGELLSNRVKNSSREEVLEFAGEIITDCILQHYFVKTLGIVGPHAKELIQDAVNSGRKTLASFGSAGIEMARTIGLAVEYGVVKVEEGLNLARKCPQVRTAEGACQSVEHGIKCAENFQQFTKEATEKFIKRLESPELVKEVIEKKLPHGFIPEPSVNIIPAKVVDGIPSYLDFKNNRWFQSADGIWRVEFSEEMQQKLGWVLENRKVLEATEFSEKINEAAKIVNIGGTKYYKIQTMPAALQERYGEMFLDIERIADKKLLLKGTEISKPSLEHIFDIQFKIVHNGKSKIHGFHHDHLRVFQRSGFMEVIEETAGPGGCYKAKVRINGIESEKTFFPAHWDRETVVKKLIEASNNIIKAKTDWAGATIANGVTKEGIEIEITIGLNGELITAYPIVGVK